MGRTRSTSRPRTRSSRRVGIEQEESTSNSTGKRQAIQTSNQKVAWHLNMVKMDSELDDNKAGTRSLDIMKQRLAAAIRDLSEPTVLSLCRSVNPPQTIVNLIIGYVSLLEKVGRHNMLRKTWEGLSKTYVNCVRALQDVGCIMRHTALLPHSLPQTLDEGLVKILNIRQKYLVGADMKGNLVSSQAPGAQAVLRLLDRAIDFAEVEFGINHIGTT